MLAPQVTNKSKNPASAIVAKASFSLQNRSSFRLRSSNRIRFGNIFNMSTESDFLEWIGDDMSKKVFSFLDDPHDIVRASLVSRSWERFVIQNDIWKQLCLKLIPEISGAVNSIEVDNDIELDGNYLEGYHKVYASLAFGLTPLLENCISSSLFASSTNNRRERIENTLDIGDATWSSIGISDPSIPDTLVYALGCQICLVSEIHIQPFQAYSARAVRFRLGCQKDDENIEFDPSTDDFEWAYTSPEYPMSRENELQIFNLPEPVLCIGGVLLVELLDKVKVKADNLFYVCISRVNVVGRTMSPLFIVKTYQPGKCLMTYFDHIHIDIWCSCRHIGQQTAEHCI